MDRGCNEETCGIIGTVILCNVQTGRYHNE